MSEARQDLRVVLAGMEKEGGLLRVKREVEPTIEIPSVMRGLSKLQKIPALLFENIKGFPGVRGCGALFSDKPRTLRALGLPIPQVELNERVVKALDNPFHRDALRKGFVKRTSIWVRWTWAR